MRAVVKPAGGRAVVCETVGTQNAVALLCQGEPRAKACRVTAGGKQIHFDLWTREKPGGALVAIGRGGEDLPESAAEAIREKLDELAASARGRKSTRRAIEWALDRRRRP